METSSDRTDPCRQCYFFANFRFDSDGERYVRSLDGRCRGNWNFREAYHCLNLSKTKVASPSTMILMFRSCGLSGAGET